MSTGSVKPKRNAAAFGVIRFDGSAIVYTAQPETLTLPLSEIAAIGEYTSESGPHADDWFLVFVNRHDGRWLEVSMYEEGPFLLEQLSNALGVFLKAEKTATIQIMQNEFDLRHIHFPRFQFALENEGVRNLSLIKDFQKRSV